MKPITLDTCQMKRLFVCKWSMYIVSRDALVHSVVAGDM